MRAKRLNPEQKQVLARLNYYDSSAGSVARFVPIDEEHGVKLYTNRNMRNLCYQRQEIAFDKGFGPKCWHPFTYRWIGVQWHGFFTERVTLRPVDTTYEEREEIAGVLRNKVAETFGISPLCNWVDMHHDNWGRTKDGRDVAIDFSHFADELGDGRKIQPSWIHKREDQRRFY